jgi:hypothetical protein
MKKKERSSKGIVKGTPSAVLLSILIHSALFLIAGMLVVFTVVKKEEKKFEPPPPAEQPKMKLKKPKVRMKKSSQPKSRTRITTRSKRSAMPNIELPEMGGIGEGLGDGIEGFDIMPDFDQVTVFGSGQTIGNDFIGSFYDLKRNRNGTFYGVGVAEFKEIVGRFVRGGFQPSTLSRFYQSPKKLYATCFMVPTVRSSVAPKAFGEDTGGWCWMVHYAGKLVSPDDITFRFRGSADDILVVAVGSQVVLNASRDSSLPIVSDWLSSHAEHRMYRMGNQGAIVGEWITLEAGVPVDMHVVGGEAPGGQFDMMLVVEEQGEEYPLNEVGAPIFPMFKTAEPNHDLRDAIYEWLVQGEVSITNGPIFSDVSAQAAPESAEKEPVPDERSTEPEHPRLWTLASGETVEADFLSHVGDRIMLKTPSGRQVKVDFVSLSDADREYIELSNPPHFNLTFSKKSSQRMIETTPHMNETAPRVLDWKFGAKAKQSSPGEYIHTLRIEYFAIGQQVLDNNKYILMDRASSSFVPCGENQRSHSFEGDRTVEMINYELHTQERGQKVKGYLILMWDERGEMIQYAASNEWLYENRENLMELPVGSFFDKTCRRMHPTGPKRAY